MNSKKLFEDFNRRPTPASIQMETSNNCNANCAFCPKRKIKPTRPEMKTSQINNIIEHTVSYANQFIPFLYQEPALEKRLPQILSYIKQTNAMCKTEVYTNMGGWTPEMVEKIVREGNLDFLYTSIYAPSEKLHMKYQKGLDYKQVWDNLKMWHETKARFKRVTPVIIWHYIGIPELIDNIGDYVDRISKYTQGGGFTHYDTFCGNVPNFGDNEKIFGAPNKKRYPCSRLWTGMNILSNGDVVPCCLDFNDTMPMGNVLDDRPDKVWKGDRFNQLRVLHLQERFEEIPLCKDCIVWKHDENPEWVKAWEEEEPKDE